MIGEGYGHLALTAPNIYDTCAHIKSDGGKVTREPGPVKGGTTEIAFVEAPGGWKYELIKRSDDWKCPMLHLMLRVGDLDRTSNFYEQVFGLSTLRESVNEAYKYTLRFVGPGREEDVRSRSCSFYSQHSLNLSLPSPFRLSVFLPS